MYIAHLSKDKLRKQSVLEHLQNTAKLSGEFADAFTCRDWGYGCGYLHDLGKYSKEFKRRIEDNGPKVDHSTAGAKEFYNRNNFLAAYCVAGHHSGLMNGGINEADGKTLIGRMSKKIPDYSAFSDEIEIPKLSNVNLVPFGKQLFSASFFVRMLYSCLVDADYLDTEAFMNDQLIPRGDYDKNEDLYDRLINYITPWLTANDSSTVNGRRSEILINCLAKGKENKGLFQLTVPTGGGKTISSLAFALEHAKKHNLKRVIYVIPYSSIIDQNADVFRNIAGDKNVLEHHCNVEYDSKEELNPMQLASENWDKPIVVTTNVQFFESLFANRSTKCRKLHNLAQSIIIFDEAQMLPKNYLMPCIWAINELVYNYQSSVVLCTATQPALTGLFENIWIKSPYITNKDQFCITEICNNITENYDFFKRSNISFLGDMGEAELINGLVDRDQILCIMNNRKSAQQVFVKLLKHKGVSNVYHLSTTMYPKHRKQILKEIKEKLLQNERCILISTSLVEAGVDLDFKTVYRELAGLDSIIQAAGRCNREGKHNKDKCETLVFEFDESHTPSSLRRPISITREIIREFDDISTPNAIYEYFNRLFSLEGEKGLDTKDIVKTLENSRIDRLPFEDIAKDFHLIEDKTITIMIGKEENAIKIADEIRAGYCTRDTMRRAGQYFVNLFEKDFVAYNAAGLLELLHEDFYLLRDNNKYTKEMGLLLNVSIGDAAFI